MGTGESGQGLRRLARPIGFLRRYYFRLLSDNDSRRRIRRLQYGWDGDGAETVDVEVRPLGASVALRPGTSDVDVFYNVFVDGYHRPPEDLPLEEPKLIWDLGANIGLTMADFAARYPTARIVGVELDSGNAALARRNTRKWSDRVDLVEGAVWTEDGVVKYGGQEGDEQGMHVLDDPGAGRDARAVCPDTLLRESGNPDRIDYLKMDIEGAERDVLRAAGSWIDRVAVIQVERHYGYTMAELEHDLNELGFDTAGGVVDRSLIGVRRDLVA